MNENVMYENYFESIYARSNSLTKDEYENACQEFERLYGKLLDSIKRNKVLDIGCGTGHFLYYLHKKGLRDYIGIDISAPQIEFCKRNITKKVKRADIFEFLRDKKNKYNFILANDVLEHLKKDRVCEFLELVSQSLEREGIFTLRVPNMSNPFSIDSRYRDFTHIGGYTEKSIFQILYSMGFNDIQISSSDVRVKSFKSFFRRQVVLFFHKLLRLFFYIQDFTVPKHLGKNLIAICKK